MCVSNYTRWAKCFVASHDVEHQQSIEPPFFCLVVKNKVEGGLYVGLETHTAPSVHPYVQLLAKNNNSSRRIYPNRIRLCTATRVFESSLGNLSTCSLLQETPVVWWMDGWMDGEEEEKSFLLARGERSARLEGDMQLFQLCVPCNILFLLVELFFFGCYIEQTKKMKWNSISKTVVNLSRDLFPLFFCSHKENNR